MDPPGPSLWLVPILAYMFSMFPYNGIEREEPVKETKILNMEYDYVIVGGGTAGTVLASRLSEDPNVTVALLEAGGQETAMSEIPGLVSFLQLSELDWQYKSEPSTTSCLAMIDNRCLYPRGKVIGGCSTINYMIYIRGNKFDYDTWQSYGNPGWGFQEVLPYFKMSEDNTNPTIVADSEYHASGGYLTVGDVFWRTPLAETFLAAARALGYPVRDCNGEYQTGFMFPQGTVRNGSRCSNARAFLRPVSGRSNLHIALYSFVKKVLIHPGLKRAYGVIYDRMEEKDLEVVARREVIISAGAINTPQLLMLSGIGPAKHLRQNNISVITDLPVGKNFMDHVSAGPIFTIDQPISLQMNRLSSFPAVLRYFFAAEGPMSSLGGVEGLGFVNSKYNNFSDWPDIEYHFIAGSHGSDSGDFFHTTLGVKDDYWTKFYYHLHDLDHFTIITKLLRPRSRGYIQLKSSDPYEHPKIISNYFNKRIDMLILVDGIKKAVELGTSKPFQIFGAAVFNRSLPGCEMYELNTDAYWECYARHMTLTIYHYCGTAKMGPPWDPEAVVDSQLRVYGVGGLRVVDASIFPIIVSGNTNAAVTMIAEKISHMIKEYYANSNSDGIPLIPVKQERMYIRRLPSARFDEL